MALGAKNIILVVILIECYHVASGQRRDWCYKQDGYDCVTPELWPEEYTPCAGKMQSPIDIQTKTSDSLNLKLKKIDLSESYSTPQPFKLQNKGKILNMFPGEESSLSVSIDGKTYEFLAGTFHWGLDESSGSEHFMNGKEYPMELQLVHRNDEREYVGCSILFELGVTENDELKPIIEALEEVKTDGTESSVSGLVLEKLLKPSTQQITQVLEYEGSLTTPNCDKMTWYIVLPTKRISRSQLEKCMSLSGNNGVPLGDSRRPIQPLERREIIPYQAVFSKALL